MFGELLNYRDRQRGLFGEGTNGTSAHKTTAVRFQSGHGESFTRQGITRYPAAGSHIERLSPGGTEEFSDLIPFGAFPIASCCCDERVVVVCVQDKILLIGLRAQPLHRVFPCGRGVAHIASRSEGVSSRIGCAGLPATMV